MVFDTVEELASFYANYGKKTGFGVSKRSSRKSLEDEEKRYATISCHRAGKSQSKTKNSLNPRPITKTECGARINAKRGSDNKWYVSKVQLKHNHPFSPSKGRFYRCNRVINARVRRQLEIFQRAGVRMNKGFNTLVVENKGYKNIPFTEKDCRNYIDKVKRLKFGEGDAEAIQSYFMKVQSTFPNFFYAWELDDENRLKSLFWADGRCRAAYEEFGDVVTFDTTYLTNKYHMPMAPFVGVNHHGQSVLLGCGLVSNEDTKSFIWLFQTWLTCMYGRAPAAIITDQDQAMKKAIEVVFPAVRHRWCLWHILKKLPDKLGRHKRYKLVKYKLKKLVYDTFTPVEFETAWNNMLEKCHLKNNRWLKGLFDERQRWVPCFVKDIFWAGMSTTQRSESINSFFDKYVNKKNDIEAENVEDFNSYNSWYSPITRYAMEEQVKAVFTNSKFKEFRNELTGKMYCEIGSSKLEEEYLQYEVVEDIMIDENIIKKLFTVRLKKADCVEECDVKCVCRLFEFRGMLCRHALKVLIGNNIYSVPTRYILKRWRKDVKRKHIKVKVSYSDWEGSEVGSRYDKMCSTFSEVADLASEFEEKCSLVLNRVNELKKEVLDGKSNDGSFVSTQKASPSKKDKVTMCRFGEKKSQGSDHKEVGGFDDNGPVKKRTKNGKEAIQNVYHVENEYSHTKYANYPHHYGGFVPHYASQEPYYPLPMNHMFHQVSQLQHLGVQVQQPSQVNSLNAAFKDPNTTFIYPNTSEFFGP
ncbi:protein FAR-RED IMPAIRED RESPONSE 1-like [Rutidosis leptorrhynchoides]|uniref:protein FAR-RED IMPAIRED RESPONSE 1-like n=1 Tax=Rutidosis leptorrhynchoides TaxID=125765 RepID=UPI003A9A488A